MWPPPWAWAAVAADPGGILLQYGAIGAIALLALYAVVKLFKRQEQLYEREIRRGDQAEEALAALNQLIREQLVVQLTRAADAIARVTELLSDQRRDEDRRGR